MTRVLAGDAGAIIGAAITPDNRTLATGSETGAVQLWDIRSGQALGAPLPGVSSSAVLPAFTPDGGHLVATYATGRAYLWDIRPASLAKHACDVAGRRLTPRGVGGVPPRPGLRPGLLNGGQRPRACAQPRGQRLEHERVKAKRGHSIAIVASTRSSQRIRGGKLVFDQVLNGGCGG